MRQPFRFVGHHPLAALQGFQGTPQEAEQTITAFAASLDEVALPTDLKEFQVRFFARCLSKNPNRRALLCDLVSDPFLNSTIGTTTSLFEDRREALPWLQLRHSVDFPKHPTAYDTLKAATVALPRPMTVREIAEGPQNELVAAVGEAAASVAREAAWLMLGHLGGRDFVQRIQSIEVLQNSSFSSELAIITLPALSRTSNPRIRWTEPAASYSPGDDAINPDFEPWLEARHRVFSEWERISLEAPCSAEIARHFPGAKIVPIVRGSSAEHIRHCAAFGFPNIALTDRGFFGRGIYFTTSMSYAAIYNPRTLFIGFLATGSVFPVVEDPQREDVHSLEGAAHVNEYDTHFVLVHSKYPGPAGWLPWCPGDEPMAPGTVEYTELVTFSSHSVIPAFIVHCV